MQFETFNRDEAAGLRDQAGPLVRVTHQRKLLFNQPAARFLEEQYGAGPRTEVALLFAAESRTVGVRPLAAAEAKALLDGERWQVEAQRGREWPLGVSAPEFVDRYRIGDGEYPATLVRGPGPRMVTFEARTREGGRSTAAGSLRSRASWAGR